MILVIDNYDSFTYNLVQYLGELGEKLEVYRNDEISINEIKVKKPSYIVISPGPGSPKDAGISKSVIKTFASKIPILGVCLGHQCIAESFRGKVVLAKNIMHGKTSPIIYKSHPLFSGVDNPFTATRYHSLLVEKKSLPKCFDVIAWTEEGEIMSIAHKEMHLYGVQFHPESILTDAGKVLLKNFLELSKK